MIAYTIMYDGVPTMSTVSPSYVMVRAIVCALQDNMGTSYNDAMDDRTAIDELTWERLVKNMLRAEMMRRGVSYEQLVARLADLGISENVLNLRNKVARGRFTAPFFAQCMVALGVEMLQIPKPTDIAGDATGEHGAQALARKGSQP